MSSQSPVVTPTDVVRVATAVAKVRAGKIGPHRSWRELLGYAWENADRARRQGYVEGQLAVAAGRGVTDGVRAEGKGWLRHETFGGTDDAPPLTARTDPDARALEFWEETKPLRTETDPRTRVILYLYGIEGLTLGEVAECVGLSKMRVSQLVAEFRAGVTERTQQGRTG